MADKTKKPMKIAVPDPGDREMLKRFWKLPKRHNGIELRVRVRNERDKWESIYSYLAKALHLRVGDSVQGRGRFKGSHVDLYATGDLAVQVAFDIKDGAVFDATVRAIHNMKLDYEKALVLTDIITVDDEPSGGTE